MTVQTSVAVGAANSARRNEIMDIVRQPPQDSYSIPNPDVSDFDRGNNNVLDVLESEEFNYGLMGASALGSAGVAAAGAASAGVAAAGTAAAVSLGTFAIAAGAGMAGGYLGSMAGAGLADLFCGTLGGGKKVATEGDAPARMGDPIGHINKNAALWGAIIGAAAAIAIVAVTVATCGAGLLVLAAAAATAGFVGAGIATFASTAGQYGDNKGVIAEGSANVFFEGRPVARVGDRVACSEHPGPSLLAEGAKTVYANGRNIVRVGHRSTCDGNVNDGCRTIVETIETAVIHEVKDSRSPALRWANIVVNLLPLPRGKKPKPGADAPPQQQKPKPDAQPKPKQDPPPAPNTSKPATTSSKGSGSQPGTNKCVSDPVDIGTGDFLQQWPVLALPGTLPLQLTRSYRSTASFRGAFGDKWMDEWSQRLELDGETATLHTPHGATLVFHTPDDEVQAVNLRERRYCLFGRRSQVLRLFDRSTRTVLSFGQEDGQTRRLSDIEDINGNRIRFHYANGALARIEHSDGYALLVQCLDRRVISVQVQGGAEDGLELLRCSYDADGRLAQCRSHQFGTLFHGYDRDGRMLRWHDTALTGAHVEYDARGRVLSTRTDSGHYADRFVYDDVRNCALYYDAEGGCSQYYHNAEGLIICQIDPLGHHWLTEWDENNLKLSQTDPLGRVTRFEYNDFDELVQVSHPDASWERYGYSSLGALTSAASSDGTQWGFSHDARGNLIAAVNPLGQRTCYRISGNGQLLRQENPDGTQLRLDYDRYQRLTKLTRADGSQHTLHKDLFGRTVESQDALGQSTRYEHADHANPRGSVSKLILADGSTQQISYDSERLPICHSDGEGRTTQYQYGAFDLLEHVHYPAGGGLQLGYDKLTRLVCVTNGVGESYRYEYDAAGRLIKETDYGGAQTRYDYNAAGWLHTTQRPDGSTVGYDYHLASGRLLAIRRRSAHPDSPSIDTKLDYDDHGRLIRVSHGDSVLEYERDAVGRLLAERSNGREVRWSYDELTGAPKELSADHQVHWAYDVNGALTSLGIEGHAPLQIQRDALGRDVQRHSAAGFQLAQQFNPLSLLTKQTAGSTPSDDALSYPSHAYGLQGQATVVQRSYQYDRAFNPVQIDQRWGSSRFRYNGNNQVIGQHLDGSAHQPSLDESFVYDGALNLVNRTLSNLPGVERHSVQQRAGRIVRQGGTTYRYDAQGRLCEKTEQPNGFRPQHWSYRWDADNRLIELTTPKGERWRYAYDGLGRRIRKLKVIAGGLRDSGQDGDSLAGPNDGSTAARAADTKRIVVGEEYLWSRDQLIEAAPIYADGTVAYDQATQWAYAPGGLTPLAQKRADKLWYVVSDHVGTPRELLDETGELAWSNSPKAWGQQRVWRRAAANDDAVDCPIRFPGQYYDAESGLHYNRHRYYDPDSAQYLSPDPLGLGGGLRPQGYVDNPNTHVDPLGLTACPPPTQGLDPNDPYVLFNTMHGTAQPKPRGVGPNGNRLQSHHGLQQEWAKQNLPGYNPNLAPTITIETGKGSPHTAISNAQNARYRDRKDSGQGVWSSTLDQELNSILGDLRSAGFSDATISKVLTQQYSMLDKLGVSYQRVSGF